MLGGHDVDAGPLGHLAGEQGVHPVALRVVRVRGWRIRLPAKHMCIQLVVVTTNLQGDRASRRD